VIWILILALVLRLVAINQSLWLDEAVQVWASSSFSIRDLLTKYMPGDFNPPLYHLLLHFWIKIFGTSEVGVRLLSLFVGLGSIWLFCLVGRRLFPKPSLIIRIIRLNELGILALLLATSPLHIYYSQENRMYMLACFAVLLAVWRFLVFLENPSWKNSFYFGFSLAIMGLSHFMTLLTIPIFLFWGIREIGVIRESKLSKLTRLLRMGTAFGLLLVAYLVYLPLFLKQLQTGLMVKSQFPIWGKTVGSFTLKSATLLPVKFIIGRIGVANKLIYGVIAGGLVVVYWLAPLIPLARYVLARCGLKFKETFVLSLLLIPPVLGFLISFWVPVFSYFRFLYVLPFFYLFVILGFKNLGKLGRLGTFGLIMVNLVCSGVYLLNPKFHRENWRGMVGWLHQKNEDNLPVLILNQVVKPFEYYDQARSNLCPIANYNQIGQCIDVSIHRYRVFLVSYALPIFDPEDKIREELRRRGYEPKIGESFRGVGIEEWRSKSLN